VCVAADDRLEYVAKPDPLLSAHPGDVETLRNLNRFFRFFHRECTVRLDPGDPGSSSSAPPVADVLIRSV